MGKLIDFSERRAARGAAGLGEVPTPADPAQQPPEIRAAERRAAEAEFHDLDQRTWALLLEDRAVGWAGQVDEFIETADGYQMEASCLGLVMQGDGAMALYAFNGFRKRLKVSRERGEKLEALAGEMNDKYNEYAAAPDMRVSTLLNLYREAFQREKRGNLRAV